MNPILAILAFSIKMVTCIIIGFLLELIRLIVGRVEKDDLLLTKILGWGVFPAMLAIAIFWLLRSVIFASLA